MKIFKNLICFSLIAMGWLQADILDNFTKAINSYTTKKLNEIKDQANSANPRSGFDRGHFVANDASFDFASNPLRE